MSDREERAPRGKSAWGDRDRWGRSGHSDRPAQGGRPERRLRQDGGKGDGGGKGKFPRLSTEIAALDAEVIQLLLKRDRLMRKMRGGKNYADKPGMVNSEKELRRAWEETAGKVSRDPRLIRQMYALMQEIEFSAKGEQEGVKAFNLSPARQPVKVAMPAPALSSYATVWLCLAALLAKPLRMDGVQKTRSLQDMTQALAQTGASVTWGSEQGEAYIELKAGGLSSWNDKAVFMGDDLLALSLLVFSRVCHTGLWRFTGGPRLRDADLSALQRFLPELGARLAFVMPHSKGLPATLECSGTLPDTVSVPSDMPAQAVLGLLVASLTWNTPIRLDLSNVPGAVAHEALAGLSEVLGRIPEAGEIGPGSASIHAFAVDAVNFPEKLNCIADPLVSAYILGLPYFIGGEASLSGNFPDTLRLQEVSGFFSSLGLTVEQGKNVLKTSGVKAPGEAAASFSPTHLHKTLHPLFWAVCGKLLRQSKTPFALPAWPEDADLDTAEDFLAQMGVVLHRPDDENPSLSLSLADEAAAADVAAKHGGWSSPDAFWTLALSLAAFSRANLKISNPNDAGDVIPGYWNLYNGLPEPRFTVGATESESQPAAPRRRIMTNHVIEPEPVLDAEKDEKSN